MAHEQTDSEWHTIRPWSRRVSLQIRDVTPVSITFILRSSLEFCGFDGLAGIEGDEEEQRNPLSISEALGRGLAVKVNGNHWQRVVVHVDEDEEVAIVIIYGLVPRKKYELTLGIVASGELFSEGITTQPGPDYDQISSNFSLGNVTSHTANAVASASTLTPPTTPVRSSPPRMITHEERVAQLRKQLALITAEREDLTSQFKLVRRESQRTETTFKGEIETLKRASEKHASGEHRSRQKVLALQEAVKQASAAAGDIEQMVQDVEATLPALTERASEVRIMHDHVKEGAERRCTELDAVEHENRKLVNELQGELTSVCAKLERVTGKKEKLEKEIPRLQEKLQELRRKVEEMERAMLEDDDTQYDNDSAIHQCNDRGWMPPIQRPPHPPTVKSPPFSSYFTLPRQPSFRSSRLPNSKIRPNTMVPTMIPSSEPILSLRKSVEEEYLTSQAGVLPSRVTSELKLGSTFHTPPRFQTHLLPLQSTSGSVVQRPSSSINDDFESLCTQSSPDDEHFSHSTNTDHGVLHTYAHRTL